MIKAFIFDCFGVLATEAWLPFKDKYFGNRPEIFEQATDLGNQANRGLISYEKLLKSVGDLAGLSADEAHNEIARNVPNQELFVYLRELKRDYKLGLLSNIARDRLEQIFDKDQLGLFDAITLSYENGYIKPQVEAYTIAAEQLGRAVNECVFVDDREGNVTGAREAGMPAILYSGIDELREEVNKLLAASQS